MDNVICLIPARSGSKGLKNKNIKLFNGVPLLFYPYNIAKHSKLIKDIAITTDSKKYLNYFKNKNIFRILRPKKNAKRGQYSAYFYTLISENTEESEKAFGR